jgi:hypothetical protein
MQGNSVLAGFREAFAFSSNHKLYLASRRIPSMSAGSRSLGLFTPSSISRGLLVRNGRYRSLYNQMICRGKKRTSSILISSFSLSSRHASALTSSRDRLEHQMFLEITRLIITAGEDPWNNVASVSRNILQLVGLLISLTKLTLMTCVKDTKGVFFGVSPRYQGFAVANSWMGGRSSFSL